MGAARIPLQNSFHHDDVRDIQDRWCQEIRTLVPSLQTEAVAAERKPNEANHKKEAAAIHDCRLFCLIDYFLVKLATIAVITEMRPIPAS